MALPEFCKAADLAKLWGIGERRVQQLANEGLPKMAPGKYHLVECCQWYCVRLSTGPGGDRSLDEQRKELLFEQTIKTRIENEISRRELLSFDEVSTAFNTSQVILASMLDAFGRRMAQVLAGHDDENEIEAILFKECRGLRREFATAQAAVGTALEDSSEPADTAPPKKRGRMGRPRKNAAPRKSGAGTVAK